MYNTNWTDEGGVKQEAQLMLTNLRDAYIGQSRSPNIVSFHVIYSFLLPVCNSNFVFTTRHFYDIRLQEML